MKPTKKAPLLLLCCVLLQCSPFLVLILCPAVSCGICGCQLYACVPGSAAVACRCIFVGITHTGSLCVDQGCYKVLLQPAGPNIEIAGEEEACQGKDEGSARQQKSDYMRGLQDVRHVLTLVLSELEEPS